MNRQTYRIVFNQARGCLMAVAETARAAGKSASGERRACLGGRGRGRALLVGLALAGSIAGPAWPQTVATRIVADRSAPGTRQPTVIYSANGVVQVDIQTPNAAGVSRNFYQRFDVGGQGAIVNNSRTAVQSQLGGWVQGNPWLARGTARVILNEVNSTDASLLHGPIEIAGSRAAFVLANPAGIQVNGGSFINASRITLSTGTPVFEGGGSLEAYRVHGGSVQIDGLGLDARGADYAAILARAVRLNAGVWAPQLHVVAGANDVPAASLASDGAPQARAIAATGTAPAFALDVSQLGGMYAGKIVLVGTEAGVGMRNVGLLQAHGGSLTLSHDGWLSNSGTLQATGDVSVKTAGALASSGLISADGQLAVTSGGTQSHSGSIASHHLRIEGASVDLRASQVSAETATIEARSGPLHAQGADIQVVQTLALHTPGQLVSDQASVQAQRLDIQAGGLSNQGGRLLQSGGSDLHIDLQGGALDNRGGTIAANAQNLSIHSGALDNTDGLVSHAGAGALGLQASRIDNTRGKIVGHGAVGIASAGDLVNEQGDVFASADLRVRTEGDLTNSGSLYAAGHQTLNVSGAVQSSGTLAAGQNLTLDAASFAATGSSVTAAGMVADGALSGSGHLHIDAKGQLQSAGQVLATGDVTLAAESIDLAHSQTGSSGGDVAITGRTGGIGTAAAQLSTPGQLTLRAARGLDNAGGQLSAEQLVLQAEDLDNQQGRISQTGSGNKLASIQLAGVFDNTGGSIVANADDFSVQSGNLTNTDGVIGHAGTGRSSIDSGALDNTRGRVIGNGNINLNAGNVLNHDGLVASAGDLDLRSTGSLQNSGSVYAAGNHTLLARGAVQSSGTLGAGQNLTIDAASFAATGNSVTAAGMTADGALSGSGHLHIDAQGQLQSAGQVLATGDVTLAAESIDLAYSQTGSSGAAGRGNVDITSRSGGISTAGGQVSTPGQLTLRAARGLDNAGGQLSAEQLMLQAEDLDNQQGRISQTGSGDELASIQLVGVFDNTGGSVVVNADDFTIRSGNLTNIDGVIGHAGTGHLRIASGAFDNTRGQIIGNGKIDLSTGDVLNHDGLVAAGGDLYVRSTGRLQNSGSLYAAGHQTLTVSGAVQSSGILAAGQNLTLDAASFAATGSSVMAAGMAADGALSGSGHLHIDAQGLLQSAGQVLATGDVTLAAESIDLAHSQTGSSGAAGGGDVAITARTGGISTAAAQVSTPGQLTMTAAQALDNAGGQLSAEQLVLQAEDLDNQQGRISQTGSGNKLASIQLAGALDNTGGSIIANADHFTVQSGNLTNTDGVIGHAGVGRLRIHSAALDNTRGQVIGKGQVGLDTEHLGNREGLVHAQHDLAITADELLNTDGRLSATGAARVSVVGAFDNNHGLLAAAQDLSLEAASVANAGGTITAIEGRLHLAGRAGGLDNRAGRVQAGHELDITLAGDLANTDGRISAVQGQARIASGMLDNAGGLVSAGQDLTIDTRGHALSNKGGRSSDPLAPLGLIAGGELKASAGTLDNRGGLIHAQGVTLSADSLDNRASGNPGDSQAALIYSGSDASIDLASAFDNTGGQLLALGQVDVRAAAVDNTQGLVRASGDVAITAASIDNTQTQDPNRGIEGQNVRLASDQIDNTRGAVRAAQGLDIRGDGQVANGDGLLSAAGVLSVGARQAATPSLQIDNTSGLMVSDGGIQIEAASLDNAQGQVLSKTHVSLGLQGDHTTAGIVQAGSDLSLATTGAIINAVALQAGRNLSIEAHDIDNRAEGQFVSGARTWLQASGKLANRGLIDGDDTRIDAAEIDNVGTGRIYGNRIAMQAGHLGNRAELPGQVPAATIAARERLDLGLQTLRNSDGALIYSEGDMTVAGALDDSGHAVGKARTIDNHGATIEAGRALALAAGDIRNTNARFETAIRPVGSPQVLSEYQHSPGDVFRVADVSTRFAESEVAVSDCETLCLNSPAGTSDAFVRYDVTRSIEQTVITRSDPGKILSGQDMTLIVDTLHNAQSQVVAGGVLDNQARQVNNDGGSGYRIVTDVGTATNHWRHRRSGHDRLASDTAAYAVQSVSAITNLGAARVDGHSSYTGVGSRPVNAAPRAVHVAASSVQASTIVPVDAPNAIIQVAAAPAPVAAGSVDAVGEPAQAGVSSAQPVQAATAQVHAPSSSSQGAVGADGVDPVDPAQASTLGNTADVQAAPAARVLTLAHSASVPTASLYRQRPEPGASYLIETDPQFTQHATWRGSDYLLDAFDPKRTHKRLGDAFYEQRLVREQVVALTGRRFLGDFSSDDAQYLALMESGLTFANAHELRPGIALTPEQMALVTSDMVWLVTQEVTLADGSRHSVLVPQVYVRIREGDLDGSGAVLGGSEVRMDVSGGLTNSGTIAGRRMVQISAQNIQNLGGAIDAQAVALSAEQDIVDLGGSLSADQLLYLDAGRDLKVSSTTAGTARQGHSVLGIGRVASLQVREGDGLLLARAGRDISFTAAGVHSAGDASLSAGRDVNLGTVRTSSSQQLAWDARNHRSDSMSQDVGSQLSARGQLVITAGRDVNATAAGVSAGELLAVDAARDVNLRAGQASQRVDVASFAAGQSGGGNKVTTTQRVSSASTSALGTSLEGQNVLVRAGRDANIRGSNVVADQDVFIDGKRNVTVEAARDTSSQGTFREDTHQGLSTSGLSVTYGKREQSVDQYSESTTAAASTIGSIGGNITIRAGETYTQTGSDVLAPGGAIDILGKVVNIDEAREREAQDTQQRFRQSGITLAITSPVVAGVQVAQQQLQAAGDTRSGRMQALAVANAAINISQAADAVSAGQAIKGGNAADQAGGIGISLSVGASSSQSQQHASSHVGRGSNVRAGGNIRIRATGAGEDSNLTIRGSDIKAGGVTALQADNDVNLLAAVNTQSESNSSRNQSGSIGIAVQFGGQGAGFGVTASANAGTGQGSGSGTSHRNTHIDGQRVVIQSGGDTTLAGAVVTADRVIADVAGDLIIESLQDTSQYSERSRSAGGSLMVGMGGGGSVNIGASDIHSTYQSVGEQSAIRAGDGGFDVRVQGETRLVGGQITSTDQAVLDGNNHFDSQEGVTLADLDNTASYSARSVSVGVGGGTSTPGGSVSAGLTGAGIGSDSGSASSTTTAGISGVAGDAAARTGDASTSLAPTFDAERVRTEINAQVRITQEFGAQAGRAIKDAFAGPRKDLENQIKDAGTPEDRQRLQQEMRDLDLQERGLNILVGALTGTGGAAVAREALAMAAQEMRELMVEESTRFPGVVDEAGNVLTNMSGPSEGQGGDGVKLGGTRVDLDLLCGPANERCARQENPDTTPILDEDGRPKLQLDEQGRVVFTATDTEGRRISIPEFLATPDGREMAGLTGGVQGVQGTLFGVPYEAGSWTDKLVEAFAGSHDYIGGSASGLYDAQGNIRQNMSPGTRAAYDNLVTVGAIPVAAPFALAESTSPEVWKVIGIILDMAR